MIDIIMPAYNAHDTIEFSLMSLAMQTIKEKINVYIVDDASNYGYEKIVSKFKSELNIKILSIQQNRGSGLAREYGINHSDSEFICFLDCDDLLFNPESLQILYDNSENYDYIYGYTYNEELNKRNYSSGDLHGKLYRRKFLIDNDIHFNSTRYHEDNAFNSLVLLHKPRIKEVNANIYYYSYNLKSITHDSKQLQFERNEIYIDNINYVMNIAINHNCEKALILEYVFIKLKYLNNIYVLSNNNEKYKLKKWLSKYPFEDYIKQFDSAKRKAIADIY